jgi:Ca2+/Na+ antiporter
MDVIFVFMFMGWSKSLSGIYCISLVLLICSLIPFLRFWCWKDRLRTREGLTEAYLFFKFSQFIQSISPGIWICFFFHDFYLKYREDNSAHDNESLQQHLAEKVNFDIDFVISSMMMMSEIALSQGDQIPDTPLSGEHDHTKYSE